MFNFVQETCTTVQETCTKNLAASRYDKHASFLYNLLVQETCIFCAGALFRLIRQVSGTCVTDISCRPQCAVLTVCYF